MITPKCKICNWRTRSGNRSYCKHQSLKRPKSSIGVHITSRAMNPRPSWCPIRVEMEGGKTDG